MGSLSANGGPREQHGEYTPQLLQTFDSVKFNIPRSGGRDVERMYIIVYSMQYTLFFVH